MKEHAAVRLFTVLDRETKKTKRICLCGTAISLASSDDFEISHPRSAWWNGLNEAEEGEEVEIHRPSGDKLYMVQAIEPVPDLAV